MWPLECTQKANQRPVRGLSVLLFLPQPLQWLIWFRSVSFIIFARLEDCHLNCPKFIIFSLQIYAIIFLLMVSNLEAYGDVSLRVWQYRFCFSFSRVLLIINVGVFFRVSIGRVGLSGGIWLLGRLCNAFLGK